MGSTRKQNTAPIILGALLRKTYRDGVFMDR